MKKQYFTLALLLLAFPFFSCAQNIVWQKLNGPSGGGGGRVYPGKDGYLVMIADDNILYRSNTDGQSWERMPATPAASSSLWPLRVGADRNLYAGYGQKLYRSVNNGLSWNVLDHNIGPENVFALPGGEILIANYDNEIKRSLDNGQTWDVVASGVSARGGFDYNSLTGEVYAWNDYPDDGEPGRLLRSSDQGQTWSSILEQPDLMPYQLAFSPNGAIFVGAESEIWRSLDNGATWTHLNGFFQNGIDEISVAVTPSGRLFAHQWYLSRYSDNNGNTWHPLTDQSENDFSLFSKGVGNRMYAVRQEGSLFYTDDDGATWHFASQGILMATPLKTISIDSSRILSYTMNGLFYSQDGGDSWQLIWDDVLGQNIFSSYEHSLAVASDGSWYLWDGNTRIIHFTDEGQSHTVLPLPVDIDQINFSGLWCGALPQTVFMANYEGFFRSADSGQTWTVVPDVFPDRTILALPAGKLLNFTNEGLYRSTDDGAHWSLVSLAGQGGSTDAFFSPNGLLYLVIGTSLMISPDEGLTWDIVNIQYANPLSSLNVNNAGHIFFRDQQSNVVIWSVDGGLTYNWVPGPGESDYYSADGLTIGPSQHLFLHKAVDGLYRSVASTTEVKLLTGYAWHDVDEDCTCQLPDSLLQGQLVKVSSSNGTVYGYSNQQGKFLTTVGSGSSEVSVVVPGDYWLSCNETVTIENNAQTGIVDSVDVGMNILTECPLATVSVTAPFLRRCFENTIYVQYQNTGTLPAPDAYVTVTLDDFFEFSGASLPVAGHDGQTFTFLLGELAVGAQGILTITVTVSCDAPLGSAHCVAAQIYPNEFCPELNTPHIVTSAVCLGDEVSLRIENIGTVGMSESLNWFVIDRNNAFSGALTSGNFLLDAGASFSTVIPSGYDVLEFWAEQAAEYPFNPISVTTIQGCGAGPGGFPPAIFSMDEAGPFTDVFCQDNIGAFDPNDKQGFPKGLTDKGYIEHGQELTYLIRFQNTGTDTAFNVSIRDTLPQWLEPATVKLLNASHACDLRLLPNGSLLFVFDHIMLPDSNVNEAASHGFVQFSVLQKPDNLTGTEIRNQAAIYFDFNEPVITNATLHTVGIPEMLTTDAGEEQLSQPLQVQIAPNPFKESVIVTLAEATRANVLLVDSYGKVVAEKAMEGRSAIIPRGNLAQGIYQVLVVNAAGKRIGSGTVVAQ